jgi:hypothetical protein
MFLLQATLITSDLYCTLCKTIIEKLMVTQILLLLMEPEGSLLSSQKPNHNPVEFSAHIYAIHLNRYEDKCTLYEGGPNLMVQHRIT